MSDDATPVTIDDIDALLSGATPQFSMQLRERLAALLERPTANPDVLAYGERQLELLDAMARGTTRGLRAPGKPAADDAGWASIPSHPAGSPLG